VAVTPVQRASFTLFSTHRIPLDDLLGLTAVEPHAGRPKMRI